MTGPGIEPGIPASLVRYSTTEPSKKIPTVQLARTTTNENANLTWNLLLTLQTIHANNSVSMC